MSIFTNQSLQNDIEKNIKIFSTAVANLRLIVNKAVTQINSNKIQIDKLTEDNTELKATKDQAENLASKIENLIK